MYARSNCADSEEAFSVDAYIAEGDLQYALLPKVDSTGSGIPAST